LDRVFLSDLIPTPHNDSGEPASSITQPDKKTASKSKSQTSDSSSLFIDKDWVSEHARQVHFSTLLLFLVLFAYANFDFNFVIINVSRMIVCGIKVVIISKFQF
jgi:hypothetical protein